MIDKTHENRLNAIAAEVRQGEEKLKNLRSKTVAIALDLLGAKSIKYVEPSVGIDKIDGFDCSGFVGTVLQKAALESGVELEVPRHANEQWRNFGEFVDYEQKMSGDLVYFPSRKKFGHFVVGHVGIVIDESEYIHAPGKDHTKVEMCRLPQERERLLDVLPSDLYRFTPVGIKRVTIPLTGGRWHIY